MKTIVNRFIPFKGFKAINLFGVIFVRKGAKMKPYNYNHKAIHTAQMKELLYLPFYLIYVGEFLFHLVKKRNWKDAYHSVSFEREAFANQSNYRYLDIRYRYAQWRKL
jgi:hypothetical protein